MPAVIAIGRIRHLPSSGLSDPLGPSFKNTLPLLLDYIIIRFSIYLS